MYKFKILILFKDDYKICLREEEFETPYIKYNDVLRDAKEFYKAKGYEPMLISVKGTDAGIRTVKLYKAYLDAMGDTDDFRKL